MQKNFDAIKRSEIPFEVLSKDVKEEYERQAKEKTFVNFKIKGLEDEDTFSGSGTVEIVLTDEEADEYEIFSDFDDAKKELLSRLESIQQNLESTMDEIKELRQREVEIEKPKAVRVESDDDETPDEQEGDTAN